VELSPLVSDRVPWGWQNLPRCLLGWNGFRMRLVLCRWYDPHSGAWLISSKACGVWQNLMCRAWSRDENPWESLLIQRAQLSHDGEASTNTFTPYLLMSYWTDLISLVLDPDSVKPQCVLQAEGNSFLACLLITKWSIRKPHVVLWFYFRLKESYLSGGVLVFQLSL